jgi:hypothetical protein
MSDNASAPERLAYRRCELVRVNGTEIDVQFLKGKNRKRRPAVSEDSLVTA